MAIDKVTMILKAIATWARFDVDNPCPPFALNPESVLKAAEEALQEAKSEEWVSVMDRAPVPGVVAWRYHKARKRGDPIHTHYSKGPVHDEEEPGRFLCDYWKPLRPPPN